MGKCSLKILKHVSMTPVLTATQQVMSGHTKCQSPVPLGDNCASAVYTLLPSKQQDVYEEMMTALLDICLSRDIRPNPIHIVADYEMAIHNAVRSVFHSCIHIQVCIE